MDALWSDSSQPDKQTAVPWYLPRSSRVQPRNMRTIPPARAALLLLALALAAACGGDAAKKEFLSYEASIEAPMAEDGTMDARLTDFMEDIRTANARTEDLATYAAGQALPFYRRFAEVVGKVGPAAEGLAAAHGVLREYVAARIAALDAVQELVAAGNRDSMKRLRELEAGLLQARRETLQATQGQFQDREMGEAFRESVLFAQQSWEPFQRGQVAPEALLEALRSRLLPALVRAAEKGRPKIAEKGVEGTLARWARAELDFQNQLVVTLPDYDRNRVARTAVEDHWKRAEERRKKYLEDVRTYREGLK
jgi:hypothetical protein